MPATSVEVADPAVATVVVVVAAAEMATDYLKNHSAKMMSETDYAAQY